MLGWQLVRRRLSVRRIALLSLLAVILIVTYSHVVTLLLLDSYPVNMNGKIELLKSKVHYSNDPLPPLNAHELEGYGGGSHKQNPKEKEKTEGPKDKPKGEEKELEKDNRPSKMSMKEYVFNIKDIENGQSHFLQEVEFDKMGQFESYGIKFNNKEVGKASKGQINITIPEYDPFYKRENATFFSLVRNEDFVGMIEAIESVEARFNSKYHYDWVFANDKPFHPTFIKVIQTLVSGQAHFVEIPKDYWSYPKWIDQSKAAEVRRQMKEAKIKYGDSEAYRHMCRFNAGLFYRLPIMKNYRFYWRVEPEIRFNCDIFEKDWFKYMNENNKKYAFTMAPLELHTTVVGLWDTVQNFAKKNKKLIAKDNNMGFLSEDGGTTYNMCHFWSNFEIGDMDFYRLEPYMKFFDLIDKEGGIYYSRWGDAPIHSMAVSLLLSKDELLFLENTGYYHKPNGDCPHNPEIKSARRCACIAVDDFTWDKSSCIPKWFEIHKFEKPDYAPKYKFVNQHHPPEEKETENEDDDSHLLEDDNE